MTTVVTRGAASAQALGYAARSTDAAFIEDVFSTYLYTGNSGTKAIDNGIDLLNKGGMVLVKSRQQTDGSTSPIGTWGVWDTARGAGTGKASTANKALSTASAGAEGLGNDYDYISAFNSNGFTAQNGPGFQTTERITNHAFQNYASWTFRKQAKFFDIVTYTGNGGGATPRAIPHNLGSTPGCIIVKYYSGTVPGGSDWYVYHRGMTTPATQFMRLSGTGGQATTTIWGSTSPTATDFYVATTTLNQSGTNYVAYVFAHDAGGFGNSGSDNVITCGSFTGAPTVTLGYEPQWLLLKPSSTTGNWQILDTTRRILGTDAASGSASGATFLNPNLSDAETFNTAYNINVSPTGFKTNGTSGTWIYVAIRRGPMKTPTIGTSVLGLSARSGNDVNTNVTGGFLADAVLIKNRGSAVGDLLSSRLTSTGYVVTSSSAAEVDGGGAVLAGNPWDLMNGVEVGTTSTITNASGNTYINYLLARAPGFLDVVCYTGTGVARTVTHGLGVAPEMMIVKNRSVAEGWRVYHSNPGATKRALLYTDDAFATDSTAWNNTAPTSSVFTVGTDNSTNQSGQLLIAYLFGSVSGVSKVGSYTGTGTTNQIDCGFTAGARFVMIKRSDNTGAWYVWDSARGIVSGNDPYFLLNSTAAEVTSTDYIDTYSAGFEISSTAPAAINANGGTFIFLAIA